MTRFSPRGQAIAESIIFLPVALLTLYGVIFAAQYGVLSERVETAVRYSGLVSNQINPYVEYSFYVLYNSLGSSSPNTPIPSQTCVPPTSDAITNSGSYPGPTMGPFWLATASPITMQCVNTNSQAAVFSSGMNQNALALSNETTISTSMTVPNYLSKAMGFTGGSIIGESTVPISRTSNFIKPADMKTLLNCHAGVQNAIESSLAPTPLAAAPAATVSAFPEPMPSPTQIPYTC
ncbi:MAG: hypothetical protein JO199_13435 [Candidatus Eremiobacteraeota bacterium]|nr:hypothetical protein [Candidatus Eremiobacteraeota bacterium]